MDRIYQILMGFVWLALGVLGFELMIDVPPSISLVTNLMMSATLLGAWLMLGMMIIKFND